MTWVTDSICEYMKRYEYTYEEAIDDMIASLENAKTDTSQKAESQEDAR